MPKLFFFVLCFWLSLSNAISPERCMHHNQKCDLHENNLIQSAAGVTGPECKQLCEDTTDCNVFTYFGQDSFPYYEFCMLFTSCDTLDECQDCITVNVMSDCICGISYEGSIHSDNIVQIEEDIQTEEDCRSICSSNSSCSVYTYYNEDHVTDAKLCILLTALHAPVQSCENCQTGPDTCKAFEECRFGFLDTGDVFSLTNSLITESKTITYISGEVSCYKTVNAVAVGSGATGGESASDRGGGGGSGYINTTEIVLHANTNFLVEIEITGAGTVFRRQDTQEILLSAANGATAPNGGTVGGDGYSGGGGYGRSGYGEAGDGGSYGQDGVDGHAAAGTGSGFDISSIVMQYYKLSGGKGGTYQQYFGGGGGGLLVDGSGPENGNIAGVGEGYGGGGEGGSVSGSQGCVILEL